MAYQESPIKTNFLSLIHGRKKETLNLVGICLLSSKRVTAFFLSLSQQWLSSSHLITSTLLANPAALPAWVMVTLSSTAWMCAWGLGQPAPRWWHFVSPKGRSAWQRPQRMLWSQGLGQQSHGRGSLPSHRTQCLTPPHQPFPSLKLLSLCPCRQGRHSLFCFPRCPFDLQTCPISLYPPFSHIIINGGFGCL